MAVLYTEPVPLAAILVYSVLLLAAFFIIKLVVSAHFIKKILGENPIILLVGPPESGKKKFMGSFRGANVRTNVYPFIGRFRTCDISINKKIFRVISFHSMKNYHTLRMGSIKMLGKRPRAIIFFLHATSNTFDIEGQRNVFATLKELFYGVPAVAVISRSDPENTNMNYFRKTFRKDMAEVYLDKKGGLKDLESRLAKIV